MCFFSYGRFVGEDEFGNRYYLKGNRRCIVYNGNLEATKVSPLWHLWLHYASDVPSEPLKNSWHKLRKPNLTGTYMAYLPSFMKKADRNLLYEKWVP